MLLAAFAACLALPAPAADWPSFRGNPGNTGATSESVALPLHLAWSFHTHGSGIVSSAAVVAGTVYAGMRDTPGLAPGPPAGGKSGRHLVNRGALLALDAATGRLKWRFSQVGGTPIGWVDSSPSVLGGRLFFTCRDGYFYCVSTAGRFLWRYHTGGMDNSSPALAGGVAYFGSGYPNTDFLALDLNSHRLKWRVSSADPHDRRQAGFVYSSPATAGNHVVFGANNGVFDCLAPSTGSPLWRFPTDGTIDFFAPAIAGNRVFAAAGDYDPVFRALNLASGKEIWRFRAPDSHNYVSSPAVADGSVYLAMGASQQQLYALEADTGRQEWAFPLGTASIEPFISSPAVAGSLVFIGSGPSQAGGGGGTLYALDARTGARRWEYPVGGPIVASPVVSGGRVFVGSLDGTLYAFASAR